MKQRNEGLTTSEFFKKARQCGISAQTINKSFNGYVAMQYQQGSLKVIGLPERRPRAIIDKRPYIGGESYKIDRLKMQMVMDAINEVRK